MFSCSRSRRWIKKVYCNENGTIFVFLLFWNSWTTGRQHLEGSLAECVRIFVFRKTAESCVLTSTANNCGGPAVNACFGTWPDKTKKNASSLYSVPGNSRALASQWLAELLNAMCIQKPCEHSTYVYISYVNTQWLHIADCNWVHVWTVHQWLMGFSYKLNKNDEHRQKQLKTQQCT